VILLDILDTPYHLEIFIFTASLISMSHRCDLFNSLSIIYPTNEPNNIIYSQQYFCLQYAVSLATRDYYSWYLKTKYKKITGSD